MTAALHASVRGHIRGHIRGRVQSVGFRAWTRRTARDLGLAGWVRNRTDGSVEALFEGPRESLEQMRAALHNGPSFARVDTVALQDVDPAGCVDFKIL